MTYSRYLEEGTARNYAGGVVYAVNDWVRLDRFLILGTEGGTYYADEKTLTLKAAQALRRCLDADYRRTVARIVEVSESGRAPRNTPALFALAVACDPRYPERTFAFDNVGTVARTGTHLFQFVDEVNSIRGWGSGFQRAVSRWYTHKTGDDLAYQVVKYRKRHGWSHKDVLRKAHPKPPTPQHDALFRWITKNEVGEVPRLVEGFEKAKRALNPTETARLVREYRLTHEMVKTEHKTNPGVWEALLERMPMMAMVRNLANMTRVGLLDWQSEATKTIVERLNSEAVLKARVHPIHVLLALKTYKMGRSTFANRIDVQLHNLRHGDVEARTWNPVGQIVDALDNAFYISFGNVEPTNQRMMLALDVSASMSWHTIGGMPITPREMSAALAMVTARTEPNYLVTAFSSRNWAHERSGIMPLSISPRQRLDDVLRVADDMPFGNTDCSLPMRWAEENKGPVEVFLIYTDNETWAGEPPMKALRRYREKSGIDAKLIVCGMTATEFSIADPDDAGSLDVVGFDSATPQLISNFSAGRI